MMLIIARIFRWNFDGFLPVLRNEELSKQQAYLYVA
jgi:hypothetical protein